MSQETDKISGRAKQAAGDITGDDDLESEGEVEEESANAKEKIDGIAEDVKGKVDRVVDSVKERLKS